MYYVSEENHENFWPVKDRNFFTPKMQLLQPEIASYQWSQWEYGNALKKM